MDGQSCRKTELLSSPNSQNSQQFFTKPSNLNAQVQRVYDELKRQNQLTGFIDELINKHGLPTWDKTKTIKTKRHPNYTMRSDSAGSIDTVVYIPLENPADLENATP